MNKNTIIEQIARLKSQLRDSFDPVEQAMLSDKLKNLQEQLRTMEFPNDKDIVLKDNIDAPIIADRESRSTSARGQQFGAVGDGSFRSMI